MSLNIYAIESIFMNIKLNSNNLYRSLFTTTVISPFSISIDFFSLLKILQRGSFVANNFQYETDSTTGALEAAYTQLTGKKIFLSEQQLVDCASEYNNFGCNGGLPSQAFEYIKYNGGLDTEETYPYQGFNGICSFKPENVGVKVIDSVNISLGAEDELKHAVGIVRPVSVAFEVVTGFRFYKKGVFTSDTCGKSPMDVNHAVLAVGYGIEDGIPYWLIKNSWGGDWGDNGYFKMELGKNMCGVATCASYPIVAV